MILNYNNDLKVEGHLKAPASDSWKVKQFPYTDHKLPEILMITTFPPKECGIATYSQDLLKALNQKFSQSFDMKICSLEKEGEKNSYTNEIKYILNTDDPDAFFKLAESINNNLAIRIVLIQHEFGFFENKEEKLYYFLNALHKQVAIAFHTVLPNPDKALKEKVQRITSVAKSVIVMTHTSAKILRNDYKVPEQKITIIPHGTHLVSHADKEFLKRKYQLSGKKVLSTFGLLSSGKSIETTLEALPAIVKNNKEVVFLIIGITHPSIVKQEGEKYRLFLEDKVDSLKLQPYVRFINHFLLLPELLEYLQLTDIYLFTSKDPNQAVSGTFSYAISCGCPIISTPMPHACEVLKNGAGKIFDFENSQQLASAVNDLLNDDQLRNKMSSKGLHWISTTAWENSAIAHAMLFEKLVNSQLVLHYNRPPINLDHLKNMTTSFGIIQFSILNHPDINSGYTLDDNSRAMIAMCQYFELTKEKEAIKYIKIYFNYIKFCLQPDGHFLNYVDEHFNFTEQNNTANLADANGRAIWALGYLISIRDLLPKELLSDAIATMNLALAYVKEIYSTRAMAFAIKGLYYCNLKNKSVESILLIYELANRLVDLYRHEADDKEWLWYESYLTYANSIMPEAMLCAWLATGEQIYKEIAQLTFDFLLSKIIVKDRIKVISNKGWLYKGEELMQVVTGGEQPIDVAYTIIALSKFYNVFQKEEYKEQMEISFNWFLGANDLQQIIYNPCSGGCYDGLETYNVNLNQGAESTVSYLMARLTMEKYKNEK